jgi:hypothetical protein
VNDVAESLIIRKENALPADVRALLHAPPPAGVWHCPSHLALGTPFRAAATLTLVLLIGALAFFVMVNVDAWNRGNLRSEGFFITLGITVLPAVLYALARRAKAKAERLEADIKAERLRFGLWLTPQYVLVHEGDQLIQCARRQDIAKSYVYHAGGGRPDLLVLELTNTSKVYIAVRWLDGWAKQEERLKAEFDSRLAAPPGFTAEDMRRRSDHYKPDGFSPFIRELDNDAQRLNSGSSEKAALLSMAEAALAAWPDKSRRAMDEWFMHTEVNATYEYGGSQSGSEKRYQGFIKGPSFWLLPLCRSVNFDEAESIFPNVAAVQDCAAALQGVPLTTIEFTGGMDDDVLDAFLAWSATLPLKALTASNYSTERSSVSNLSDRQRKKLADFKAVHHVA